MKHAFVVVVLVVAFAGTAWGQAPAAPTPITDVHKLTIKNLAQQMTIAQLSMEKAQRDFTEAQEALTRLVQSLQVPGYDLNLQTFEYMKKPDPPKAPEKK